MPSGTFTPPAWCFAQAKTWKITWSAFFSQGFTEEEKTNCCRKRKPMSADSANKSHCGIIPIHTWALLFLLPIFFFLSHVFTAWLLVSALFFSSSMLTESGKKKVCKPGIKKLRCWSRVWHETWHHHHPKTSLSLSFPWKDGLWRKPISLCIPFKFLIWICISAALTAHSASAELMLLNAGLAAFSLPRQRGCCWACAPLVTKRTDEFGMLCFPRSLAITVQLFWHFRNTKLSFISALSLLEMVVLLHFGCTKDRSSEVASTQVTAESC